MPVFHSQIEEAEQEVESLKHSYLRRFGWDNTSNTPGSFWLWRRDFAKEDAERHTNWAKRPPGPYGKSSEPRPYGVITASIDLAVSMTVRCLDEQEEMAEENAE